MKWHDWQPLYNQIVEKLDLNPNDDRRATSVLSSMLAGFDSQPVLDIVDSLIRCRNVIVCGAGPSLSRHLERIDSRKTDHISTFIAADGATSALLDRGVQVDIIVTDLDGDMDDIITATQQGAIPIVHAHGDNIPAIKKNIPMLQSVLGSTQVEPQTNVFLWGGFTDGDRACYLACHYSPAKLILAGMDFGQIVGKWSKPKYKHHARASKRKTEKLKIALELLDHLWNMAHVEYEIMR